MFGGFAPIHWLLVLLVALLLFGNRLPEVARSIGRSINEFKRGMRDVKDEFDEDGEPSPRLRRPPEDEHGPVSHDEKGKTESEKEPSETHPR